jgi:LTXXQ motif family protein
MRRTRISILCVAVLAAMPASAEAGGLGSVVGAVANAPRALLGGLLGGGRGGHHRHHARRANPERSVARAAPERSVVRAAPAIPAEPKSADHGTAAFWSSAYDDAFGYVLASAGYDEAFWGRGYADVVDAMFAPSAADAAGSKRGQAGRSPEADKSGPEADKSGGFALAPACAEPRNADAVSERIERTVQPTAAQRAAFDELRIALQAAAERVGAACAVDTPAGPGARLEAMWRRLRALRQAVIMVRAPLRNFYDSLNDEQRARLDTAVREGAGPRTSAAREARPASLRACGQSARMPEWPVASIAQAIQPTEEQRPMLELLMGTSLHYAHELRASCLAGPAPLTPMARLEAVDERLTAIVYAVTVLRGTLNRFYVSLTEEQRAKFDAMSPPPRPAGGRRVELH